MLIMVSSVCHLVFFEFLSYHVFECILKEPEEVKKPAPPSAPAKKPEVPKKGTLYFLLFDIVSSE